MLCTRCALCCDGTLFGRMTLTAADDVRLRRLPLLASAMQGDVLPQPCVALAAMRCTIYDARPEACASYRCLLLAGLEAGHIDETHALAVIRRAHELMNAIRAMLTPEQRRRGIWRGSDARLDDLAEIDTPAARAERSELVRERLTLSLLLANEIDPEAADHEAVCSDA